MATLYMVATPIGNLEDMSLRAARVLGEVDTVACEDTRHTLKLLSHLGIRKPLVACHAQDEAKGSARILGILAQGRDVAYCSDAGTPGISDPGVMAASLAREAGHAVVPIPGPSALSALASAAGLFFKSVTFDGFPSPKPGRRRARVAELMSRGEAFVMYESPFRVLRLLGDIAGVDPGRQVCVGREMTKIHEEFVRGTASDVLAELSSRADIKGELAVLVAGLPGKEVRKARRAEAGRRGTGDADRAPGDASRDGPDTDYDDDEEEEGDD